MTLHEKMKEEAAKLHWLADRLADDELEGDDGGYEQATFDRTIEDVNQLCARVLHAVGEHNFDIDDYPPQP